MSVAFVARSEAQGSTRTFRVAILKKSPAPSGQAEITFIRGTGFIGIGGKGNNQI